MDPETAAAGVSSGTLRPEMHPLAKISGTGTGSLNPSAGDLAVKARWGYRSGSGAIMPGQGRAVERGYEPEELAAMQRGSEQLNMAYDEMLSALGETTYDVYLSNAAYWKNVPARVWEYTTGGYRVVKKWLSYRELEVLARPLSVEEARYLRDVARRIAALLLMGPRLDKNYRSVVASGRGLHRP